MENSSSAPSLLLLLGSLLVPVSSVELVLEVVVRADELTLTTLELDSEKLLRTIELALIQISAFMAQHKNFKIPSLRLSFFYI